ncbi:MAG TPA: metalloregulator ArsR/SmtB family transcription factor [Phaeodactylibacter sp.]|nr:metalloregulator ArsR/SmtB family transcription factor [Phaeodactylibacter sp.]
MATSRLNRFERQTEILRSIAHPIRLAMIELLQRGRRLSVSEIHSALKIEQATASHHLKILRQVGIVKVEREGRYSYYLLADEVYPQIVELLG